MIKEKKIESKLAAYSMLAAGVLAFGTDANAQAVYTDIDPDETFTAAGTYDLDMNNDATADFHVTLLLEASYNFTGLMCETGNEAFGFYTAGWMYPFAMNLNDAISGTAAGDWGAQVANVNSLCSMAYSFPAGSQYGYWFGVTDKYLGLRFVVGANTHYGWARLDVASDGASFTIKDYAYNSTADAAINAGEGGVGIQDNVLNDVSVYAYNKTIFLNLNGNNHQNGTITITNLLGQQVDVFNISDSKMEINLYDQQSGIYMVTVNTAEGIYTRKVHLN